MYSNLNDIELLTLIKAGNDTAFTVLYDRYWKKLFYVAGSKLNNLSVAEEIVQDIFVDLWNRRVTIEVKGELGAYLAVAVKYRVINVQARQHKARNYQLYALANLATADHSTEEVLRFQELKHKLAKLVNALPENNKLVFQLSREHGLSHKAIAQQTNTTEKAVERTLYRTVKSLSVGLREFFSILSFF